MRLSRRVLVLTPFVVALLIGGLTATVRATPGPPTTPIYNSIPSPLPPNVPSLGFQASHTAEFGDDIIFAPATPRQVFSATVPMSDFALRSDYPTWPTDANGNWTWPITLNLYNVDHSGPAPALGSLITTVTQTASIPWRPPADPTCSPNTNWRASDGNCYSGIAFDVTFNLNGVTVPDEVIFGVAFNTQDFGASPTHTGGPFISLNEGLTTAPPTVGTDPDPDDVFWNTNVPGNYTDGGTGGVGIFRRDTAWAPDQPAITVALGCDHTVTGRQPSSLNLNGGSWCLNGANVGGAVTIGPGTTAIITNSTIGSDVRATNGGAFSLCGSTVRGALNVTGASGFVLVGDPGDDACAGNQLLSSVDLIGNQSGVELSHNTRISGNTTLNNNVGSGPLAEDAHPEVEANRMLGALSCSGNSPTPTNDGQPNTVSGVRSGQCSGF